MSSGPQAGEITAPEYYPLFSIVDRSLLPVDLGLDIASQIEDEDVVIVTREQIEDGSVARGDKGKKRPTDPKQGKGGSAAAAAGTSKKVRVVRFSSSSSTENMYFSTY